VRVLAVGFIDTFHFMTRCHTITLSKVISVKVGLGETLS
jgi:hypothetical protein